MTIGLRVVLARNPSPMTLDGTRTFVIGRSRPVVIDPGPDIPDHLRSIRATLGGARPAAILLTHGHPDHAAAAAGLAGSTGAAVRMAAGALTGDPAPEIERIHDGEQVETDAGSLRAVATPGHAPEHLAFHWTGEQAPERGGVFVGDLLMGEGDTTLVASPEGDLAAYLRSLDRVEELGATVLYPSHGPPITDPTAVIARYRAHREQRLQQLREALRDQPGAGIDTLVTTIYGPDLDRRLRSAAAGSIRAMLDYLGRTVGP